MNSFHVFLAVGVSTVALSNVACSEDSDGGSGAAGDAGSGGASGTGGGTATGGATGSGGGAATGGAATGGATGSGGGSGAGGASAAGGAAPGDSGAESSAPDAANDECTQYCSDFLAECGSHGSNTYTDQADCELACAGFAHGAPGNNDNTFECRRTHLDYILDGQSAALHCGHTAEVPAGFCAN
jgi:hypothetical protein